MLPGKKRFLADADQFAETPLAASSAPPPPVDESAAFQSKKHRAFAQYVAADEPPLAADGDGAPISRVAPHNIPPGARSAAVAEPSSSSAAATRHDDDDDDDDGPVRVAAVEAVAPPQPVTSRRSENERGQAIYCVCQLPYDGRPMIGCDSCDEWYHLACMGISDARAAAMANQKYICFRCVRDNGVELERRRHRTCLAVKCKRDARPHSRYCSDECGVAHATFTIRRARQKEIEARERAAEERRVERRRRKAIAAQTRERAALEELERIVDAANVDADGLARTGDAVDARAVLRRVLAAVVQPDAAAATAAAAPADDAALIEALPLNVRHDARQLLDIETQLRRLRAERVRLERRAATARCCARVASRLLAESGAEDASTGGGGGAQDEDAAADENMSIECATCGKLVGASAYPRHIAQCYSTQELIHQPRVPHAPAAPISMFCDVFDAKSKTYCKKLKVACPHHPPGAAPVRKATAEEKAAEKASEKVEASKRKNRKGAATGARTTLCAFPPVIVNDGELDAIFVRLLTDGNDDDALTTFPPPPSGDDAYSSAAISARLDERLEALQDRLDESQLTLDALQPCRELGNSCPRHNNWGLLAEMRLLQEAIRIETDEFTLRNRAAESRARIERRTKKARTDRPV